MRRTHDGHQLGGVENFTARTGMNRGIQYL
jgi:hypothetical protein